MDVEVDVDVDAGLVAFVPAQNEHAKHCAMNTHMNIGHHTQAQISKRTTTLWIPKHLFNALAGYVHL